MQCAVEGPAFPWAAARKRVPHPVAHFAIEPALSLSKGWESKNPKPTSHPRTGKWKEFRYQNYLVLRRTGLARRRGRLGAAFSSFFAAGAGAVTFPEAAFLGRTAFRSASTSSSESSRTSPGGTSSTSGP